MVGDLLSMRIEGDIRRIASQGVVYTELSSPHALRNPLSSDSLKLWLMDNILSRQRREKISSMVDWLIKLCVLLSSLLLAKVLNHPSGKNLRIARTTFDKLQEVNRAGRSQPGEVNQFLEGRQQTLRSQQKSAVSL